MAPLPLIMTMKFLFREQILPIPSAILQNQPALGGAMALRFIV